MAMVRRTKTARTHLRTALFSTAASGAAAGGNLQRWRSADSAGRAVRRRPAVVAPPRGLSRAENQETDRFAIEELKMPSLRECSPQLVTLARHMLSFQPFSAVSGDLTDSAGTLRNSTNDPRTMVHGPWCTRCTRCCFAMPDAAPQLLLTSVL